MSANTQQNTEVNASNSRFIKHMQVDESKIMSPGEYTRNGEGYWFLSES